MNIIPTGNMIWTNNQLRRTGISGGNIFDGDAAFQPEEGQSAGEKEWFSWTH
jgi:hypothetical protein